MADYLLPKINTAYVFYVSLPSQANVNVFQANPTLTAGDVTVSIDGAAAANITTLPTVTPAGGKRVNVSLSAAEMNGDNISVVFSDVAGAEWCDQQFDIQTAVRGVADLGTSTYAGGAVASVTSFGTLVADMTAAVWAAATRALTDKAGFALTSGERTAIANEVEAQIIDDTDSEKVLTAITNKIAAVDPDLGSLTLSAIAAAVRLNLTVELARIDAAITSRLATAGYTAPANPSDYARNNVAPSWWTAPDNADVVTALADLVLLLGRTDPTAALLLIQAVTDALAPLIEDGQFTAEALEFAPTSGGGGLSQADVRAALGMADDDMDDQLDAILAEAGTGGVLYGEGGSVPYTYTQFEPGGVVPLPGVNVYVYLVSDPTHRSQIKVTDDLGRVQFDLDPATVGFHREKAFCVFSNPDIQVIS